MDALHSVSVAKVAELLDLNNLTKEMNLKERAIECSDVNRPALQLSGYFDHFEERRIQIIGNVEYTYIEKMSDSEKKERYSRFMEFDIPCIIFCRDLQPDEIFMEEAREHGIPVLSTGRSTSSFMAELIYCLGEQLALNGEAGLPESKPSSSRRWYNVFQARSVFLLFLSVSIIFHVNL